jgi:hypothetical protein
MNEPISYAGSNPLKYFNPTGKHNDERRHPEQHLNRIPRKRGIAR